MQQPFLLLLAVFSVVTLVKAQQQRNLNSTTGYSYGLRTTANAADAMLSPNRIVGGTVINIAQSPYTVALILKKRLLCGGSVIAKRWILTAAHCLQAPGRYKVRAGTRTFRSGGQTIEVLRRITFGSYNPETSEHDIALLQLTKSFNFNRFVQPIALPSRSTPLPNVFTIAGWGTVTYKANSVSDELRAAQVAYYSKNVCINAYKEVTPITETMFCAAAPGKDSCQGDSGGPLASNNVQFGIVSFGIGCANPRYPGVYTDVRYYIDWIQTTLQKFGG